MTEAHGIKSGMKHHNCRMYLLGHVGLLEEAENLIEKADCRDDPSLLTVLLGASTASSHSAIAERIAKKVIDLKPEHHLSSVY
jgi:hypothetical protein